MKSTAPVNCVDSLKLFFNLLQSRTLAFLTDLQSIELTLNGQKVFFKKTTTTKNDLTGPNSHHN